MPTLFARVLIRSLCSRSQTRVMTPRAPPPPCPLPKPLSRIAKPSEENRLFENGGGNTEVCGWFRTRSVAEYHCVHFVLKRASQTPVHFAFGYRKHHRKANFDSSDEFMHTSTSLGSPATPSLVANACLAPPKRKSYGDRQQLFR